MSRSVEQFETWLGHTLPDLVIIIPQQSCDDGTCFEVVECCCMTPESMLLLLSDAGVGSTNASCCQLYVSPSLEVPPTAGPSQPHTDRVAKQIIRVLLLAWHQHMYQQIFSTNSICKEQDMSLVYALTLYTVGVHYSVSFTLVPKPARFLCRFKHVTCSEQLHSCCCPLIERGIVWPNNLTYWSNQAVAMVNYIM